MVEAFLLLNVHPGQETGVKEKILSLPYIQSCKITFGEYDLIAQIDVPSVEKLGKFISKQVRAIEGVKKSATIIVSDSIQ